MTAAARDEGDSQAVRGERSTALASAAHSAQSRLSSLLAAAPDAVITFGEDGLYWHLDHVGIHERTTTAVQTFGAAAPALYYVTMESGVMPAIVEQARAWGWQPPARGFWSLDPNAFGIGAVPPTVNVNVAEWVPRKLAAIRCHRSQMGASHPLETIELAEARRLLGVEHFHRSALTGNAAPILEYL